MLSNLDLLPVAESFRYCVGHEALQCIRVEHCIHVLL